jgi:hypothetical protein
MDTHGLYDIVITLPAAKSLPLSRRQNIRHVTLEEDRAAVALPERHAEGLISLCVRSPNLPVERRVGPLRNILPGGDLAIRAGCIYGYLYLADTITWMKEAQELFARGMPRGSYCVIIDVEAEECESAWKLLERAAALQDAMVNAARVSAIRPSPNAPPRPFMDRPYELPRDLRRDFSRTIREILQGTSFIRLSDATTTAREVWDQDTLNHSTMDSTLEEWHIEWNKIIDSYINVDYGKRLWNQYTMPKKQVFNVLQNGQVIQQYPTQR